MPIQVPRARANLMTSKYLNQVQSEVKSKGENDLGRYIIGGTYCIFFIYILAYLSLEVALGIDIYYFIDTQLIMLFVFNFKPVVTYCIFMGIFIYFVLTLFCGYMAFELGRYVIATGDALPLIIVILLALLSIHCIRQVCKAIKNKDLDILD